VDALQTVAAFVDLAAVEHVLDLHEDEHVEHECLVGGVLLLEAALEGVACHGSVQQHEAFRIAEEAELGSVCLETAGHERVCELKEDAHDDRLDNTHGGHTYHDAFVDDLLLPTLGFAE